MSVKQTVRLAREVADKHSVLSERYFYGAVLRRTLHRNSDVTVKDMTLWQQAKYAMEHLTPEDLTRQAEELIASTLEVAT